MCRPLSFFAIWLFLLGSPSARGADAAEQAAGEPVCSEVTAEVDLSAPGLTIGDVEIHIGDIFDPNAEGENRWAYRWINKLHIESKPSVVEQLLLFRSGDAYDPRLLAESERLLRAERFFYDASIHPVRLCGDRIDIAVDVRDVWTLFASASVTRSGGVNNTRFELEDGNFLGLGKNIGIARRSNIDRTQLSAFYRDHNFLGGRTRFELWYSDNSDGSFEVFDLTRPFYALDTRRAAGLRIRLDDREDKRFLFGEQLDKFRHQQDFAEAWAGFSPGLREGSAFRLLVGGTYLRDLFTKPKEEGVLFRLPESRTLAYPWVGFEWVEDDYRRESDLDQLRRTEDLQLGRELSGRIGWSSEALGGDRDRAIFALALHDGHSWGEDKKLLLWNSYTNGRWSTEDGLENFQLGGRVSFYWRNWRENVLFVQIGADVTDNLDEEVQLLLGGDNGLRGYPLRYQLGDRRFLVTLEQRFYTPLHLFKLVHVGGAVFADVGRAWFDDPANDTRPSFFPRIGNEKMLRDVGLGLRLSSSRSGRGTVVHVDLAFPLDGDNSIDNVQYLVSTKESF